eukprot:COSAG04_NODE_21963_length_364_cov_0.603774_1_plen_23_part_01
MLLWAVGRSFMLQCNNAPEPIAN